MPKARPVPVRLDRREWDFSECPESELFDCWCYEFARELDWVRDFAATQKEKTLEYAALYSFLIFPHWPETPYLSVSQSERLRLRRTVRPDEEELEASLLDLDDVPEGIKAQFRLVLERSGRPILRSKTGRIQVSLFRLDWQFSDSMLLRFFKSYLSENRPSNIHPTEHRGRAVPDAKRKQQLRELGMFRLARANNGSVALARRAAGETGDDSPWYRAVKTVEELLRNGETEIVPRLSREALTVEKRKARPC
jgi:hypothetical protein